MAREQGKQRSESEEDERDEGGRVPELVRRAIALGLTGFFTTEEAFRRALGDTVPKDWLDFASDQGDRWRAQLADRLAAEFGRVLDQVDLAELAAAVLQGRTVEVTAQIRLRPRDDEPG
jgi:hypothetical protein